MALSFNSISLFYFNSIPLNILLHRILASLRLHTTRMLSGLSFIRAFFFPFTGIF